MITASQRVAEWRMKNGRPYAYNERTKNRSRNWREQHPEEHKVFARKSKLKCFWLTIEQYDEILVRQNNQCAICGNNHCDAARRRLAVDHNHDTGAVRGLLCGNCNRALGMFKDNIDIVRKAVAYLEQENAPKST